MRGQGPVKAGNETLANYGDFFQTLHMSGGEFHLTALIISDGEAQRDTSSQLTLI
ncbi:hypothetical protein [Roseobacter litoralis]|uniref:hypothetical protein n=1 Tax=Roseobacter litoralis TaxID=42443 RepID=UPI000160E419|nr:hypothetical protein [Roseobacter litoralis]